MELMQLFSLQNPLVKHFCRLKDDRGYRLSSGSFLVEGRKMVAEALTRLCVKAVVATDEALLPQGVKGYVVTEALLKKMSSHTNPEGIMAEVAFSSVQVLTNESYLLVLDNVQDPGNVGTLIRTALALGWEAVVLVGTTADPFSPKALNAAKGATFRLPIVTMTAKELAAYCQNKITLVAADSKGKAFQKRGPAALILGNEGHGLSPEMAALASEKVAISLKGDMESLNVAIAGAILLYGLKN